MLKSFFLSIKLCIVQVESNPGPDGEKEKDESRNKSTKVFIPPCVLYIPPCVVDILTNNPYKKHLA